MVTYERNGRLVGKKVCIADLGRWNGCAYELVQAADAKDPLNLCDKGIVRRLVSESEKSVTGSEGKEQNVGSIRGWLRKNLGLRE